MPGGRRSTRCLPPRFPRRFCLRVLARGTRVTSCALQQLQVPALDTSADLVGADAAAAHLPLPLAELAAARTMIDYLKHKVGIKRVHKGGTACDVAVQPGGRQLDIRQRAWPACVGLPAFTLHPAHTTPIPHPLLIGQVVNLDRGLSMAQRAEAAAFTALVEARLQVCEAGEAPSS